MKQKLTAMLLLMTAALLSACAAQPAPAQSEAPAQSGTSAQDSTAQSENAAPESPVLSNETGFPDLMQFEAAALDGSRYSNADLASADVTVINLWGTFCGPCISEMPEIAAFQQKLPENVHLITCCVDVSAADEAGIRTAESILNEAGYTGITLVSPTGDLLTLCNQMMYVPTTVFLDSQGHLLGEAIIGAGNVSENYTAHINAALRAMGKDELAF
ncbi:MAG: TlpA family protein disulfide reductase [Oscillospiraceae bacterium]|nr:TlpA family protein disulfide reductase [Oscillospiraceae bacterium]